MTGNWPLADGREVHFGVRQVGDSQLMRAGPAHRFRRVAGLLGNDRDEIDRPTCSPWEACPRPRSCFHPSSLAGDTPRPEQQIVRCAVLAIPISPLRNRSICVGLGVCGTRRRPSCRQTRYAMSLRPASPSVNTGPRVLIVAFRNKPSTAANFTPWMARFGAAAALSSAANEPISFSTPALTIGYTPTIASFAATSSQDISMAPSFSSTAWKTFRVGTQVTCPGSRPLARSGSR